MAQQTSTNTGFDLRGLLLVALGAAWLLGIVLASFDAPAPFIPLLGAFGAALAMLALWHDKRGRMIAFLLTFLFLGAWRYTSVLPSSNPLAVSRYIGAGSLKIKGTVSNEPELRGKLRLLQVTVSNVSRDGGKTWQEAQGPVEVQTLGTKIDDPYGANYGNGVQAMGKLQPPSPQSPPGTFASMAFPRLSVGSNAGNPVIAFLYHLRATFATSITQALPQPEAALLIAVLLGLRTAALKPLSQTFNVTGTAHLIATSGFKVTILASLVVALTGWIGTIRGRPAEGRFAHRRNRGWRAWLATGFVLLSIAAYTVLSGAGPAAIRAGVMGIILALAPRIGRTYTLYTALSLTAMLMSALDPFVLWDAGFQLSFLGTLGIVLLTPFMLRLLHPIERVPGGYYLAETVAVTLAAQVATLPIFATTFGQVSFVAPLANLLTVPLLGLMMMLGMILCAASLIFGQLALLCGWLAWPVLWFVLHVISWCASLPYAFVTVGTVNAALAWGYYGLLGLLVGFFLKRWPNQVHPQQQHAPHSGLSHPLKLALMAGAALLILSALGIAALTTHIGGSMTVTFLDLAPPGQTAQGDAIFIRAPDGRTALIDGGMDAAALAQALDSRLPPWQRSLDTVLLTSPQQSHLNGLLDIITRYTIVTVFDGGMLHPSTTYARWRRTISERHFAYRQLSQGATISVGAQVAVQVLSPLSLHKGSNEVRDNSLVLRLITPQLRILLLGTAAQSKYALTQLEHSLDASYLQAEVVQLEGAVRIPFPAELGQALALAHPIWLVVTPASQRTKPGKAASTTLPPGPWQVVQTAQNGDVEIVCYNTVWTLSTG